MRGGFKTIVHPAAVHDGPTPASVERDLHADKHRLLDAVARAADAGDEDVVMELAIELAQNRLRRALVLGATEERAA